MMLVRAFGKDKGSNEVWALYLTILTLFETIKQGLLRNPTIKFLNLPEYANKKFEVQSAAIVINVFFSMIAIVVLVPGGTFIASALNTPELLPLLWWSFLFVILLVPFNHFEVMLQANYQFQKIFWAYFVRQGLFFSGIAIMYIFFRSHFTPMNLLLLQIVALLTGTIILYYSVKPYLLKRFHYDLVIIRHMFHFGKYIFGTNLFSNVSRSFDHFVTANTLTPIEGKEYVSYYNAVTRINNMIDVPSLAASDVLFPKNVETLQTDGLGKVKYYFERMIGTILAVIVPISLFIFVFPKFIIHIIAGPEYYGAIPILQITILFSLVRPLSYQFGSTLDAIGKPQVNFWANCCFMLFNLGLNYLFLSKFRGIGAAYASVVNYSVSFVIMIFILKKYIHVELSKIYLYALQSYKDLFALGRKLLLKTNGS